MSNFSLDINNAIKIGNNGNNSILENQFKINSEIFDKFSMEYEENINSFGDNENYKKKKKNKKKVIFFFFFKKKCSNLEKY